MHEFQVGDWASVKAPFDIAYPAVYRVVGVTPYDDPDTPEGVIDQTISVDIDHGPDVDPRDFANKHLELADEPPGIGIL